MSIGNKKILFVIALVLFVLLLPRVIFAWTPPTFPYWGGPGGLVSCTGNAYSTTINPGGSGGTNPRTCTSLCDLIQTMVNFAYFGITIAVLLVAPVLFAWGGIMMMLAGGDPGKMSQGKKIFTGTLIGMLISLGAFLIVYTFIQILGVGGTGPGQIQGFTSGFSCTASYSGTPPAGGGGGGGVTSCASDASCPSGNRCDLSGGAAGCICVAGLRPGTCGSGSGPACSGTTFGNNCPAPQTCQDLCAFNGTGVPCYICR